MPNTKGGKAYKKTKTATENAVFQELESDQMYGRMIKNLGGLNLMVYCNDGYERICHIRGALRKRAWMNEGDIVIVCFREFLHAEKGKERGDIVAKVDSKFYTRIKKMPNINPKLFDNVEKQTAEQRRTIPAPTENGFEFEETNEEGGSQYEEEESNSDKDVDVDDI